MLELRKIGPSPSGKALGFGPSIRRFESCRSSHETKERPERSLFSFVFVSDRMRTEGSDAVGGE